MLIRTAVPCRSFAEIDQRFPGGDFIRGFRRGHVLTLFDRVRRDREREREREREKGGGRNKCSPRQVPLHPLTPCCSSRKRPSHYEARVKSESSRTRVPIDDSHRLAVTIDFPSDFRAMINNNHDVSILRARAHT